MSQEHNVSESDDNAAVQVPQGGEGYEALLEGDESLDALGGTGIELIHHGVTALTAEE
jgi:hypothetical protein